MASRLVDLIVTRKFLRKPPRLLISITGGAQNLDIMENHLLRIQDDIVTAAVITGGCIVTGGTDAGIMKEVGSGLARLDTNHEVDCLGIAAFQKMAEPTKEEVLLAKDFDRNVVLQQKIKLDPNTASLNPNHSHFILVDSETNPGWGGEIKLRAEVEERYAFINQIPLILVVVGGGPGTLTTIVESISNGHYPIIIVKESGGMADILARLLEDDENVVNQISSDPMLSKHWDQILKALKHSRRSGAVKVVDYDKISVTSVLMDLACNAMLTHSATTINARAQKYNNLSVYAMIKRMLEMQKYADVELRLRDLYALYTTHRGNIIMRDRLYSILHHSLLTALCQHPERDNSDHGRDRASIVKYIISVMTTNKEWQISKVVNINHLYALRTIFAVGKAKVGRDDSMQPAGTATASADQKSANATNSSQSVTLTFSGWILNYAPVTIEVGREDTIATVKKALVTKMQQELQSSKAVAHHFVQANIMEVSDVDIFEGDTKAQKLSRGGSVRKFYITSAGMLVVFICLTLILIYENVLRASLLYFWPACFAYFVFRARVQSHELKVPDTTLYTFACRLHVDTVGNLLRFPAAAVAATADRNNWARCFMRGSGKLIG